jgi:hypothetical protein
MSGGGLVVRIKYGGFWNGTFVLTVVHGFVCRAEARHSIQGVHFRDTECQNMDRRSESRRSIQNVPFRYIV